MRSEEIMEPLELSAAALARVLHLPAYRIAAIINGQHSLRQARPTVAEEIERETSPRGTRVPAY